MGQRDKLCIPAFFFFLTFFLPQRAAGLFFLFFATPFLRISGQPVLLLNVIDRQFVILGQVFWPQDIFLFVLASLVFTVCIVLFTIAFGRIFCGWICPQTIFMEMVFRRIEV